MRNENAQLLWEEGEYSYKMACGFEPNFVPYIHDDEKIRPCIIVVPGGGYCFVSPAEGEIIADRFFDMGYNTFVLTYTVNPLMNEPLLDTALKDISRAIRLIRRDANKFHIDENKLYLCGFSAGGHLCADICVNFDKVKDPNKELDAISNRADAAILSYPVINATTYAHEGSFMAKYGKDIYDRAKKGDADAIKTLDDASLEKHVNKNTTPCFVWHAREDDCVPMQNSLLFFKALANEGVDCALHIFGKGGHGLSLANSEWAHGRVGDRYCEEQVYAVVDALRRGEIDISEEEKENYLQAVHVPTKEDLKWNKINKEVSRWPQLANEWLESLS